MTFDRSPKRQRVGAAPPATPPHAPRLRPPAPATPEMRHAPAVTQSPPGPPTAGGSSSDDESVPAPRRKWAPPTGRLQLFGRRGGGSPRGRPTTTRTTATTRPPPPAPPSASAASAATAASCPNASPTGLRVPRERRESHGHHAPRLRRMPTLLLAAYRGDAAAVAALPLLFQRREIVIGLGMREEGEGEGTGPERDSAAASSGHR